jgi:hypothetical protein
MSGAKEELVEAVMKIFADISPDFIQVIFRNLGFTLSKNNLIEKSSYLEILAYALSSIAISFAIHFSIKNISKHEGASKNKWIKFLAYYFIALILFIATMKVFE